METFVCSTRLCFGENALQALQTLGAKRAFLVTDPFFAKNGTAQRILSLLSGAETEIFDQVGGEPTLAMVAQGVDQLQKFRPDTLLALGGGSAIDCAKGILSLAQSEARLVAIPTTSGTGSEVTFTAVMHDVENQRKISTRNREKLVPDYALLDPEMTKDLPPYFTAITGMDRMTFQPAAGAHGEYMGLLLIKAYHECRGDKNEDGVREPLQRLAAPGRPRG